MLIFGTYVFTGTNDQDWSWTFIHEVESASGIKELETSIGERPTAVYFHMVNWNESCEDMSDERITPVDVSIPGTRDYNTGITADGTIDTGEWNAADQVDSESSGDTSPSNVDIVDVYLAHDDNNFYCRVDFDDFA